MNNVKNKNLTLLTLLFLSLLAVPALNAMDYEEEIDRAKKIEELKNLGITDPEIINAVLKYKDEDKEDADQKKKEEEEEENKLEKIKNQGAKEAIPGLSGKKEKAKEENGKEEENSMELPEKDTASNSWFKELKNKTVNWIWQSAVNTKNKAQNFDYKPHMTKKNAAIVTTVFGLGISYYAYKNHQSNLVKQAQLQKTKEELEKIKAKYDILLKPFEERGINPTTIIAFFIDTFTDEDYEKYGKDKKEDGLTIIELFTQDALENPSHLELIKMALPGFKLTLEQQYLIGYLNNLLEENQDSILEISQEEEANLSKFKSKVI